MGKINASDKIIYSNCSDKLTSDSHSDFADFMNKKGFQIKIIRIAAYSLIFPLF